ncbi:hypothetical protein ACU4IU_12595 [Brevibacterium sp. CSND-B09]|uniref:hypothetical protein n=1 Tax=Brevibacterium sp. CSND-B09 TaxID=3462571 RepID=UPI00406AACDE
MNDEAAMRNLVESLFHPEAEPQNNDPTEPVTVSAPVINSQADTPDPLTLQDANRIAANSGTAGALGALFNKNPFHNL